MVTARTTFNLINVAEIRKVFSHRKDIGILTAVKAISTQQSENAMLSLGKAVIVCSGSASIQPLIFTTII